VTNVTAPYIPYLYNKKLGGEEERKKRQEVRLNKDEVYYSSRRFPSSSRALCESPDDYEQAFGEVTKREE
jgi:hypothetical protein